MAIIETDPQIWAQTEARKAISGLDKLQSSLTIDELAEKPGPELEEIYEFAVINLDFLNNQVDPMVGEFYELKRLNFEFSPKFKLRLTEKRLITYNTPEVPHALGFSFAPPDRKPARVTENMLKRLLFGGIEPDAVEALATPSKEEIIAKIKSQIIRASSIK